MGIWAEVRGDLVFFEHHEIQNSNVLRGQKRVNSGFSGESRGTTYQGFILIKKYTLMEDLLDHR